MFQRSIIMDRKMLRKRRPLNWTSCSWRTDLVFCLFALVVRGIACHTDNTNRVTYYKMPVRATYLYWLGRIELRIIKDEKSPSNHAQQLCFHIYSRCINSAANLLKRILTRPGFKLAKNVPCFTCTYVHKRHCSSSVMKISNIRL